MTNLTPSGRVGPTPGPETSATVIVTTTEPNRLRGRGLVLARALWVTVALIYIALFIASVPGYFEYLRTICPADPVCTLGPNPYPSAQAIQAAGLTPTVVAAYQMPMWVFKRGWLYTHPCIHLLAAI